MPLLQWSEEFETGIDYLDFEHRQLLELVNCVYRKSLQTESMDSIGQYLGELHVKVCGHFALEEKLMQEQDYTLYEQHKAHHERLLDEIRNMMDAYENGACENCGKLLEDCLTVWFHKHFRIKDAQLESLRPLKK